MGRLASPARANEFISLVFLQEDDQEMSKLQQHTETSTKLNYSTILNFYGFRDIKVASFITDFMTLTRVTRVQSLSWDRLGCIPSTCCLQTTVSKTEQKGGPINSQQYISLFFSKFFKMCVQK